MEIAKKFGERWYIFYSQKDADWAEKIWERSPDNDFFEDELNYLGLAYDHLWEE